MKNEKFKKGDRIIVIRDKLQTKGRLGTVYVEKSYNHGNCIGVRLDGCGVTLYYNKESIKLVDDFNEKENVMKVEGNYRVALVRFLDGVNTIKSYAFALFDDEIVENDLVICDSANRYCVAKVEKIMMKEEYTGVTVTKEIICKVDFTDFEKRKEDRKKKAELKKKMDKMVADSQEIALYQMLAKDNPEMAEMLEEYKKLINS